MGDRTHAFLPPVAARLLAGGPEPSASSLQDVLPGLTAPRVQRQALAGDEEETPVQPRLEVGPAGDRYEREADAVAAAVMRMPEPPAADAGAGSAGDLGLASAVVQRACSGCATKDEEVRRQEDPSAAEEADEEVRAQAAEGAQAGPRAEPTGAPSLASTPARLTTGGQALPDATRHFYESRLGRDLSRVRLHVGSAAASMSRSIRAHAFTYGEHIWLGRDQRTAPSFTLAHELAHVLQQTRPGRLSARAREDRSTSTTPAPPTPAPRRIQRKSEPYWIPTDNDWDSPTKTHDKVVEALGVKNSSFITEAAIPNGSRTFRAPGFADLYKATPPRTVGVAVTPRKKGVDTIGVSPLRFPRNKPTWPPRPMKKGGQPYDHNAESAPQKRPPPGANRLQWKILDLDKAPTDIALGEVKSGFQEWPRSLTGNQLQRYRDRIQGVRDAIDTLPDERIQDGHQTRPRWSVNTRLLGDTEVKLPDGYAHGDASGGVTRNVVLKKRAGGKTYKPDPSHPVTARLVVAPDPDHDAAWLYIWVPENRREAKQLAGGASTEFGALATQLDDLVDDLTASPTKPRGRALPPGASTARAAVPVPAAAPVRTELAQPRRSVRRRATRKRYRDTFNFKKWEGKRKKLTTTYRRFRRRRGAAFTELEAQEAAVGADGLLARKLPGYKSKQSEKTRTNVRRMQKLELMTGLRGRTIGYLRRIFGRAFVRVADGYQKLKDRFGRRMKAPTKGVPGGGFGKAAFKALVSLLRISARLVLGRATAILAQRLEDCIGAEVKKLFGFDEDVLDLSAYEAQIDKIEALKQEFVELATTSSTALAERLLGPYKDLFETMQTALKAFGGITTVIDLVKWGVRLAACAAPPAVGCLWNLALGALEFVVSRVIQSCWFLKKVTPHIFKVDWIGRLPAAVATGAQQALAAILPESLRKYVCADGVEKELKGVAVPTEAEVNAELDCSRDYKPKAPQEVIDKLEQLTALDEDKMKVLMDWMRKNRVPRNTKVDWEKVLEFVRVIQEANISDDELEQLLEQSSDADADSPLKRLTTEMLEKAARQRQANRRAARERARRQAAKKGGKGGGEGATGGGGGADAGQGGPGGRGAERGTGGGAPAVVHDRATAVPEGASSRPAGVFEFWILEGLVGGGAYHRGDSYPVKLKVRSQGREAIVTGVQITYVEDTTVTHQGRVHPVMRMFFTEDRYVPKIDLVIVGGSRSLTWYVFPAVASASAPAQEN